MKLKLKLIPLLAYCLVLLTALMQNACTPHKKAVPFDLNQVIQESGNQLLLLTESTDKAISGNDSVDSKGRKLVVPRSLDSLANLKLIPASDWCSGFFPGSLWMMYQLTGESKWKDAAERFTLLLENEKFNGGTHDMGFKMMCSFGNAYKMTGNPAYREILIQSATTLITRFNPKIGAIRSWDHNSDKWQYPVIIDNMMNLELLYWASKETGDSVFAAVASKHAETTLANHFRPDNSSWHVVDYDTLTGLPVHKHTHQGYSHESAWSRGQAWGLYGYTMVYRETGKQEFLQQAVKIADFMLKHPRLPEDLVPLWDFDAPGNLEEPRDVSAATIMASALFELAQFVPGENPDYKALANKIIENVAMKYMAEKGKKSGFVLDHSTGSKPHNGEVDVPIIYADYYFLEALNRKKQIETIK